MHMHQFQPVTLHLLDVFWKLIRLQERDCKKFDVCYVLAKEGLSFKKYSKILELESRHEVNIGVAYRNDVSARTFVHYIAKSQRQYFLQSFSEKHFFSVLLDGTTDSSNLEDELVVILYCGKHEASTEK